MATIDEHRPWRPVQNYIGIIAATYIAQIIMPGAILGWRTPFPLLGLVALAVTLIVTWGGLYLTPSAWLHDDASKVKRYCLQFRRVLIVFFFMMTVLVAYIVGFDRLSKQIDVPVGLTEDEWEDLSQEKKDEILAKDPELVPGEDRSSGVEQGFLTVTLAVVTFILKKFVLAYTDMFPIDVGWDGGWTMEGRGYGGSWWVRFGKAVPAGYR